MTTMPDRVIPMRTESRTDTPTFGHNSAEKPAVGTTQARISQVVEQVIRIKGEIKDLQTDVKELFKGAKDEGLSPKVLKKVIKIIEDREAIGAEVIDGENTEVDLYLKACGQLPLFGSIEP